MALVMMPFAAGCAAGPDASSSRSGDGALSGDLHILVAASLLPVAQVLADDFEQLHPAVDVQIAGAGSAALREQVLAGAPADVFIPASPVHLDAVRDEVGLASAAVVVARNSLVLAVPAGNDAGVTSLADLARPELLIGLCAAEVPCGALARRGLARAGIEPYPDTDEPNVRALVTKLAAGELDAAVVYASDAAPSARGGTSLDAVVSLGWTAGTAPQTSYAAAVLADAPNGVAAAAFADYLGSGAARSTFADFGFALP
ncbi:molybdate ABC transporter substrate-binding protein [Candidatus Poriferisodalis sp.]|uniref:molybdate ABC transporter substrate-binding protein n=1 Tax=Candidatus Poriferisodalis sp. TaxID=3101277 RepID=UPI003B521F23